jgi:[NiFe] hydrogenase assembly HybE family chaperone
VNLATHEAATTRHERLAVAARVGQLSRAFEDIQHTRMHGVPLLHPALWVEAVDFEPCAAPWASQGDAAPEAGPADGALGVLITPWFMNLVLLPLHPGAAAAVLPGQPAGSACADLWRVGQAQARDIGGERFEFIGAHEPAFGAFAACSLFSPMFDFPNQAVARATAQAVLASLRTRPGTPPTEARPAVSAAAAAAASAAVGGISGPSTAAATAAATVTTSPHSLSQAPGLSTAPARRAFLFGRSPA